MHKKGGTTTTSNSMIALAPTFVRHSKEMHTEGHESRWLKNTLRNHSNQPIHTAHSLWVDGQGHKHTSRAEHDAPSSFLCLPTRPLHPSSDLPEPLSSGGSRGCLALTTHRCGVNGTCV